MSKKPMMSVHRDGDTLVLRVPMVLNPRLPRLYDMLRSAVGHPLLVRAGVAALIQAILLCAPTFEDAEQALDEYDARASQPSPDSTVN